MTNLELILIFATASNITGWAINMMFVKRMHDLYESSLQISSRHLEIAEIYLEWQREEHGEDTIL